jgi:toxin FitB
VPGYLLDTDAFYEMRKANPDPNVAAWLSSVDAESIYLSVVVAGEIRTRIERLRRRDPVQATVIDTWLDELLATYADRIVPIDLQIAEEWGRLAGGRPPPGVDGLLAATASVHEWTLVTRNVREFPKELDILNPFEPPA